VFLGRIDLSCLNIHLILILKPAPHFNWKLYNYRNNNCNNNEAITLTIITAEIQIAVLGVNRIKGSKEMNDEVQSVISKL